MKYDGKHMLFNQQDHFHISNNFKLKLSHTLQQGFLHHKPKHTL